MKKVLLFLFVFICFFNVLKAQESKASKQISTFTMDAPQLKTTKIIWLYLPKNYTTSNKKYPVIMQRKSKNK